MKANFKVLRHIALISIVTISIIVAGFSFYKFNSKGPLTEDKNVVIPSGISLLNIAYILEKDGVIADSDFFSYAVRIFYDARSIKAGEYNFPAKISALDVYKKISSGDTVVRQITIPEGKMAVEIVEIINSTEGLKGQIVEPFVEGSLLPDTYNYSYGDMKNSIIRRMKREMAVFIAKEWEGRDKTIPIKNKKDLVTLASIVEKETALAEERSLVASVFINRLNKGMKLQSDPTTIYGITKGKYVLKRPITKKDLNSKNEYNTYGFYGLPAGPISNPGKDSIMAVLHPEKSDYLYFVADGTGGHVFSKTLKEHNNNVLKWRKIEKAKKNNG